MNLVILKIKDRNGGDQVFYKLFMSFLFIAVLAVSDARAVEKPLHPAKPEQTEEQCAQVVSFNSGTGEERRSEEMGFEDAKDAALNTVPEAGFHNFVVSCSYLSDDREVGESG